MNTLFQLKAKCILFLLISFFKPIFTLIEIDSYYNYVNNEIMIYYGSNQVRAYIGLDLTQEYTWLNYPEVTDYTSSTAQFFNDNKQIQYCDKYYQGVSIEDTFKFQMSEPFPLTFLIVSCLLNKSTAKRGIISLAYSFPSQNYSIVHRLKAAGQINHLSFAFKNQYTLYLGGIPNEEIENKFHSHCDVLGYNNSWNCALSEVNVIMRGEVSTYHSKDNFITFNTHKEHNFVPKEFFDLLVNSVYKQEFDKKYYHLTITNNKRQIYSYDDGELKLGEITFTIGDYVYNISLAKFWYCYEIACDLNIYENPNGDYWVFGMQLLNDYNVQFDYEDKRVYFYSKSGVTNYKPLFKTSLSTCSILLFGIIIVTVILMTLGIGLIVISKYKYLKNKQDYNMNP